MKKKIGFVHKPCSFIFLLFLLTVAAASSALADKAVSISGISFSIDKVTYGQLPTSRHYLISDTVEHANTGEEAPGYVAISVVISNINGSKKIDLDRKIVYSLFDELGNRYRPMRKPDDYKASVLIVSKSFPGLFPGEKYGETVFFEAPAANARTLKLVIDPDGFNIAKPVELTCERDQTAGPSAPVPTPSTDTTQRPPLAGPSEIRIVSPVSGGVWDQGQSARVQVDLTGGQTPKKIIVIALDNTFTDPSPKQNNLYDINVPIDQAPGEYLINVIAQWPDGNTSSAVVKFFVKDATPLGVL